jgi:hypothetical protein
MRPRRARQQQQLGARRGGGASRIAQVDIIRYYRRNTLRHNMFGLAKSPEFSTSDATTGTCRASGRRRSSATVELNERTFRSSGRPVHAVTAGVALEHPMQRPATARLAADSDPARPERMPGWTVRRRPRLFPSSPGPL